jgi:hypothetical protein
MTAIIYPNDAIYAVFLMRAKNMLKLGYLIAS